MEAIQSNETEIVGGWIFKDGRATEDVASKRVWSLINGHLQKIAFSDSGWEQLFLDPADNRYWELWFPHSEMHGGGPRSLRMLTLEQVAQKYQIEFK